MKSRLKFIKMKYSEEGKVLTNQHFTDQFVTFDLSIQIEQNIKPRTVEGDKKKWLQFIHKAIAEQYKKWLFEVLFCEKVKKLW